MSSPLGLYESLDVIGTGSFGIIRKVRRRSDGLIFARKELNFERMSERDRKQIVAEVNILKDLHHEHIVRYHDRYVDRDAGMLYILMEYCGGGDLSAIIKLAQRQGRPIPEDTVWSYFMQILLALNYCHHPNGYGRSSSAGTCESDGREKRPQVLHRDIKPDNVFLDESNTAKLGDFGLSKALTQASFANTYVGTPYYMSPELMQERAYDNKSDIWSLGCLIYELCALKPPFHEAKTHTELSLLIRNGRIPPLPKGYSPALTNIIKSMLNLNPALRPSAAQLLGHERLELAFKVSETQKLLNTVKTHKAALQTRERDLIAREAAAAEQEASLNSKLTAKDEEIASLRTLVASAEGLLQTRVREAVSRRDEELRALVLKHEEEVAARMARREEEIMEAVRKREEEIARMWAEWESQTREAMGKAVEERMEWVRAQVEDIEQEKERLDGLKVELERKAVTLEANERKGVATARTPLEEVKNILAPLARLAEAPDRTPVRAPIQSADVFETPRPLAMKATLGNVAPPSAMKGVILTATGEPVATPTPAELAKLFVDTPKIGLNFARIFDFDSEGEEDGYETDTKPSSSRRASAGSDARPQQQDCEDDKTPQPSPATKPTRLRRPSIRASSQRPQLDPVPSTSARSKEPSRPPSSASSASSSAKSTNAIVSKPAPEYDLSDEENLPSPFLKKQDREAFARTASAPAQPKPTAGARNAPRKSGSTLRAMAVVNAANAANSEKGSLGSGRAALRTASVVNIGPGRAANVRPSIAKAHRASEEARKALSRT
ncbi:uncharacterized protein FIBRA_08367 [Fibroporia radiculosa]|uniref:non-specific serine/threonine protein kinase n=1 Tax=Fibroporia radiculosa TaxID=599839 RepID=J4GH75_9APHY|nr:uncharacterized protein FIBRA_08367 [Fibroporia radiculosa]CCM06118.1 predicted protein [Fibroporia radiculosa]